MQRHNPRFVRETVLAVLMRANRQRTPFIPIQLIDLPFDEYREPPKEKPQPRG